MAVYLSRVLGRAPNSHTSLTAIHLACMIVSVFESFIGNHTATLDVSKQSFGFDGKKCETLGDKFTVQFGD